MTKEESIAYAIKLQKDFLDRDAIERQIEDNKKNLDSRSEITYRNRSFFRFFWPVLPISVAIYYIGNIVVNILIDYLNDHQILWAVNIKYLLIIAVIVAGAVISIVKKVKIYREYENASKEERARKEQLRKDTRDLEEKLEALNSEIAQNMTNVPYNHRSSAAMAKIKLMLQTGKAEDFDDAVSKL